MPDFMGIKRIGAKLGSGDPSKEGRFGTGIGNNGAVNTTSYADDFLPQNELLTRAAQFVLEFIFLIVAIILASWQSKWLGAPSGLSGFLLFIALLNIVMSLLVTVVPLVHERSGFKTLKGAARLLREGRVGLIINGGMAGINALTAVIQTISTTTLKGCKNHANDASVDKQKHGTKEQYISALGTFCNTKRAETAFAWFVMLTWVAALGFFFMNWRSSRKNGPRIPPFQHPIDDSAFEPIQYAGEDVDDDDDRGDYAGIASHRYGEGGDGRYGNGPAYGTTSGMPPGGYASPGTAGRDSFDMRNPNPFADQHRIPFGTGPPAYGGGRPSYDYQYGGGSPGYGARPY